MQVDLKDKNNIKWLKEAAMNNHLSIDELVDDIVCSYRGAKEGIKHDKATS
jgi:hypothetical protein